MLDYQINESILKAYIESVCREKHYNFKNKNFINESDKTITPELVEKRNKRRRRRGDKEVSYERELKRERRRYNKPNYASEFGKGFVRASNVGARELLHMVPGTYALFGGNSENAEKMKKGIDDWFNPIIYDEYGSDYGDEISASSEPGGKLFSTMIPAAGAAKALKIAGGAKFISNVMKYLNTGSKGEMLWKIPVGVAASRALQSGVEAGSQNLKNAGYEDAGELLGEYGGFAPWVIAPLGSMTRYGTTPSIDYAQKRFGNEDTKTIVDGFKKYALGTYEEDNQDIDIPKETIDNNDTNKEDETFIKCPLCIFSCNDDDVMIDHLRNKHNIDN